MSEVNTGNSGGHKAAGVRSKKRSTKIDMTPMVDLAFLLLTFFMLATTFHKPTVMSLNMPEKPDSTDTRTRVPDEKALTLVLGGNNKVFWYMGMTKPSSAVQRTDYSSKGIRKVLFEKSKQVPGLTVLIKPDDKSNYQNIVDILDEMSITEVKKYALVDITNVDKDLIKGF